MRIGSCAGRVHLQDLVLPQTTTSNNFTVTDAAMVTVANLTTAGLPAIQLTRSAVVFTDCQITAVPWVTASPAMVIDGGSIAVVGGTARGGPGSLSAPGPAIDLRSGSLLLAGRNTLITAGATGTPTATPAISSSGGRVDLDPAVTLVARGSAPQISGPATVVRRPIPSLRADGLASLGTWRLDLHAPTGSPFCAFASLPVTPVPSPWGALWFDAANHLVLGCGTVGPGDQTRFSLPLPALPRGVPIVAQAAAAVSGIPELGVAAIDIVE